MGSVPNVGLMAQKAEEYGTHDKTFEIPADGTVKVVECRRRGRPVARGRGGRHLARLPDQGRPDPGLGKLAVNRARARHPAIFWLDESRAHDPRSSPRSRTI